MKSLRELLRTSGWSRNLTPSQFERVVDEATEKSVDPQPLLDLRQEEIGQLCGLTRQHVNITLQRLQQDALIRIEPRGITVLDIEGLRNFGGMGWHTESPACARRACGTNVP